MGRRFGLEFVDHRSAKATVLDAGQQLDAGELDQAGIGDSPWFARASGRERRADPDSPPWRRR
jgi:hypothetical protein